MGGRRSSRRRRQRAKVEESTEDSPAKASSPPSSGSSGVSSDRTVHRKIPHHHEAAAAPPEGTPRDTCAVRRNLLSLIRSYYLEAVARLPAADLRTALARGVLVGGHCYGPMAPLHNILANSIWYAAAFPLRIPAADRIESDVISANSLCRAVHRSLDGLLAALRRRFPGLSHDDALWHLHLARADLRHAAAAEPEAKSAAGFDFLVAAEAARHPKPAALAHFAASALPAVERDVATLLAGKRRLSSADVARLSAMLAPSPLPDELPSPSPRELSRKVIRIIEDRRNILRKINKETLQIVDVALRKYAHQTGEKEQYQLHTIYGENLVRDYKKFDDYLHINFMATNAKAPASPVVFFFTEAVRPTHSGDYAEEDITVCCTVQPSESDVDSCHACLIQKYKIDHPYDGKHFGGKQYKTDEIVDEWDCPIIIDTDYKFFDPDRDISLVHCLHESITYFDDVPKLGNDDDSDEEDISSYSMLFV